MPQWFGHNNKWDHEAEDLLIQGRGYIRTPARSLEPDTHYNNDWLYSEELGLETTTESFDFGGLVLGITTLLLISKIIRNKRIDPSDMYFVLMWLLRLAIPEIGVAYCMFGTYRLIAESPSIYRNVKSWFKNNVNKRSELETELRLLNQI